MEEKLRENSRLNSLLLDSIPSPAILADADQVVIGANRAALAIGIKIGKPCQDGFCKGKYREVCLAQRAIDENQTMHCETELFDRVWDTFWVPVGKDAYLHYLVDITERKQGEMALRESEERYRTLFESGNDALFFLDAKGRFLDFNNVAFERLGYSREELQRMSIQDITAPEAAASIPQYVQEVRERGHTVFEAQEVRRDGSSFPVEVSVRGLSHKGKPAALAISRDISERRRAENALRQYARQLDSLQESLLEITSQRDLPKLLNSIVERAAMLLGASSGGLYLCDADRREARCVVSYNTKVNVVGSVLKYGEGAAGVVAQTGKPLIIDDYEKWSGRAAVYEETSPFRAVLSAPMIWQGQVIGVIHVLRYDAKRFTDEDLQLLKLFADHAAIGVENQRFSDNLERMVTERTAKLAETQNQLQTLADSLPALISYIDSDQKYRFNNKAYEELFGQSLETILGRHVREVLSEQGYERIQARIEAALSGVPQSFEYELPVKSGTRHMSATYIPDFGEHREVKGIFILGIDITERKRLEEELRASREQLEYTIDSNPAVIYLGKPLEDMSDYYPLYMSKNVESMVGFGPEEFMGRKGAAFWASRVHPDDLLKYREGTSKFWEERRRTSEYRFLHKNGTYRWILEEANVMCDSTGTVRDVIGYWTDITERKRMEEELRASRERLELIVTSNPAVIYSGKPLPDFSDWIMTYISERVTEMLGFEPQELVGHPEFWEHHVPPEDAQLVRAAIPSLWKEGQYTIEYRFRHKDGTYRWIREEARLIRDVETKPMEVYGYWIDITEQKQLENALLVSQRLAAIGQLAAMVSHDLRNPLQGISAASYLLRNDQSTAEERNEILQLIDDNLQHADEIVSELLDYSREIHLALTEVTPKEITRSALEVVKVPDTIQVRDQSQERPIVRVDSDRMKRVFINLITNAVDAMPNGGTITISTKESNGLMEIAVSDTGTGLDRGILENLWKPLQTTKAKGMGLGLPIVKRIIDAHGGEVSVESKVGEGTTFTIRLPIKPKAVNKHE
jgi:PAS domain S-box-containing protein